MIIENYLPDTKSSSVKKREALLSLVVGEEFPGSALLAHINNYNSKGNNHDMPLARGADATNATSPPGRSNDMPLIRAVIGIHA